MITVVLIEDHDLTRIGLRIALQQSGKVTVVGEAATGIEGLKVLAKARPDVAIVDIGLPDIDGVEITRRLKQSLTGLEDLDSPKPRVLILTMQENEEAVLAAFAAGADSYCVKDASLEWLLEALQTTTEGNSWIDPTIARVVLRQVQHQGLPLQAASDRTNERLDLPEDSGPDYALTDRELEVLKLIVAGCSNAVISEKLHITVGTVKTHVRNILSKLSADDRTQAAVRALRSGLV
ncbi:DNA-binding response regulator [Leptolyngbya sp. 'hensonii']|uniref:response regulator n=1 Tax=Leptolyngbya sp. 'hensonii' TaxID=1922337 RepID=UPI00094F6D83|nr:response regulator transcription factor [Leptolyngbya sp. 'hensonii']OLP17270.1 DNA-binding response regulator [Leptolyngbya sp. 'hensonii']